MTHTDTADEQSHQRAADLETAARLLQLDDAVTAALEAAGLSRTVIRSGA